MAHRTDAVRRVLRTARSEIQPYVWILVAMAGVLAFLGVAETVREGETRRIDEAILVGLRDANDLARGVGPDWVVGAVRDLTSLGSMAVLVLVTIAFAGWLALRRQHHAMYLMVASALTGVLLGQALKGLFDRPRPDVVPHLARVTSLSFPSGHAMLSAVVYLTIGAIAARMVEGRLMKAYLLALALFATFVVGFTRVYLGVHYPSDVVAGWTAGLVWAIVCWTAAARLQQKGSVEPSK